jgi:predicted DNA-binding antitoxin AbrB/MazE fold protein
MSITVQATYENGTLKLAEPLPLNEHDKVTVTIHAEKSWVEETYGNLGWKGSVEELERFALDPELDPQEGP